MLLLALLARSFCLLRSRSDFIYANSYLELEFYMAEQANLPILMLEHYDNSSTSYNKSISIIEGAIEQEPYGYMVIVVDCVELHKTNSSINVFCYEPNPRRRGRKDQTSLKILKPDEETVVFKEEAFKRVPSHEPFSGEVNSLYVVDKVLMALPRVEDILDNEDDLRQFLQKSTLDKAVFLTDVFDDNINFRKIAAEFTGKIDVAITDRPAVLQRFGKFALPGLVVLKYNWKTTLFQAVEFRGRLEEDSKENFLALYDFLKPYSRVTRYRYFVMETSIHMKNVTFDSREDIVRMAQQEDRLILLLAYNTTRDDRLLQAQDKIYGSTFIYGHYDCRCTSFRGVPTPALVLVDKDLLDVHPLQNSYEWLNRTFAYRPPESYSIISSENQFGSCVVHTTQENRLPVVFHPASARDDFYVMYALRDRLLRKMVRFCNAKYLNEETALKYNISRGDFMYFQPENSEKQGGFKVGKVSQIKQFDEFRSFLQQAGRKPLKNLLQRLNSTVLSEVKSSETLQKQCVDRYCVLLFSNPTSQQHSRELQLFSRLQREFNDLHQFFWVDGLCHKETLRQLKIDVVSLPQIIIYSEKHIKFAEFKGKKYLDYRELRRWMRRYRSINHMSLGRLKGSLEIQNKKCALSKANDL